MDNIDHIARGEVKKEKEVAVFQKATILISGLLVVYLLITKLFHSPEPFWDHSVYILSCVLILFCNKYPKCTGIKRVIITVGTVCAIVGVVYVMLSTQRIYDNYLQATETADFYFFIIFFIGAVILLVDNAAGKVISGLAVASVAYLFIGRYVDGVFSCPAFNLNQIATMVYISYDQGVFGQYVALISHILAIFFLFSSLLAVTGLGDWIRSVSMLLAGKSRGGPAKVAVVSSAMFGMLSGSAVSNVASTGSFTIPLMKKIGYKPETAAAIETVASTGGGITPPIMGLASFMMAEILGISYLKVIIFAIIPAFLWYYSIFIYVHLNAITQNVKIWSPPKDELIKTFKETAHLIIPIIVLLITLIYLRIAEVAALYAVISLFILSSFRKRTRLNLAKIKTLLLSFSKILATIGVLNTVLGVFVGAVLSTGTHTKLIAVLVGGMTNWVVVAIIIFILCIIFGMLVPPFVAYITVVLVAVPAFSNMDFDVRAVHMFVLFLCTLAPITPPVALASFTAASIAGSDEMKTAKEAAVKSLCLWMIPFILFRYKIFIGMNNDWIFLSKWVFILLVGITVFSCGVNKYFFGKLSNYWSCWMIAIALMIMQPVNQSVTFLGVVLGLGSFVILYTKRKIPDLLSDANKA